MSKNNIIKIIRTTTANLASLLLNPGELAIDTTTQKLYCGTDGATFTDQLTPLNNSISLVDVLEAIYPVGALYFANTSSTTCPLETLGFGTWQLVAQDACIQGSSTSHASGSTLSAGLPEISGTVAGNAQAANRLTGAFTFPVGLPGVTGLGFVTNSQGSLTFNASNSNAIYGNSATVQPPAYVVNIWERVTSNGGGSVINVNPDYSAFYTKSEVDTMIAGTSGNSLPGSSPINYGELKTGVNTYTASEDGYVYALNDAKTQGEQILLFNENNGLTSRAVAVKSSVISNTLPVQKGDTFRVENTTTGTTYKRLWLFPIRGNI